MYDTVDIMNLTVQIHHVRTSTTPVALLLILFLLTFIDLLSSCFCAHAVEVINVAAAKPIFASSDRLAVSSDGNKQDEDDLGGAICSPL